MAGIPKKYIKAVMNIILAISIIFFCVFAAPKIILLFMPFVIGWFLAFLANPAVCFLEKKMKIKRKTGTALVIVVVIAVLCILIFTMGSRLVKEVIGLLRTMPDMWQSIEMEFVGLTKEWSQMMDSLPEEMVEKVKQMGDAFENEVSVVVGKLSVPTVDTLGEFVGNMPGIIMGIIMCLLSAYFFCAEKEYVGGIVRKILPHSCKNKCCLLKQTTVDVIGAYLKAQFKIEIRVYVVLAIGLLMLKVKYWYAIAFGIALLDILPVLGTGIVLIPWMIYEFLAGSYIYGLGLFVIWGVGQLVRQIIQPKVIGESVGMASIPTLILIYLGYKLAGVAGMIAAVPLGMIVLAMDEAGFFENCKNSIGILWNGLHKFRHLTEEDLQGIQKNETKL